MSLRSVRWATVLDGQDAMARRFRFPGDTPNCPSHRQRNWHEYEGLHAEDPGSGNPSYDDLPFGDILSAFARSSHERFRVQAAVWPLFSDNALACLERQLVAHLSFVATLILEQEFELFRFQQDASYGLPDSLRPQTSSDRLYRAFCTRMRRGGFTRLLSGQPVLARLLSQSCLQWEWNSHALCARFTEDLPDLQRQLAWPDNAAGARVQAIRTDLSDRHDGGQTVAELISGNGARLFYKPRPVDGEWAFQRLARRLLAGSPISIRTVRCVRRSGYGWCESIAHRPCHSSDEITAFYRNAGALLTLAHIFAATDLHFENLIAEGSNLVLVDLETLLCDWVGEQGSWTVLNTGMLPRLRSTHDGTSYDLSGLAAGASQRSQIERREWIGLGCDDMHLSEPVTVQPSWKHRPFLDGVAADPADHVNAIVDGFRECYDWIMVHHCRDLNGLNLRELDGLNLRVMLRSTETYSSLHLRLLHPEFLVDGIDRSIELEWLARPLTAPEADRARVAIYEHERQAMEQLDIPRFSSQFADIISLEGGSAEVHFLRQRRDGALVAKRIAGMSPADREHQCQIIRRSFEALAAGAEI